MKTTKIKCKVPSGVIKLWLASPSTESRWSAVMDNFYRQQRSCGKVMFLHLSVILSTGEVSGRYPSRQTPPVGRHLPGQTPLGRHPPRADTFPSGQTPPRQTPPSRRLLQRTVCILLECILVCQWFSKMLHSSVLWENVASSCMIYPYGFALIISIIPNGHEVNIRQLIR